MGRNKRYLSNRIFIILLVIFVLLFITGDYFFVRWMYG